MSVLTFWVSGVPVPKGRPRTVRTKKGQVRTFTPARTAHWEDVVRLGAQSACSAVRWKPSPGKYVVELFVHRARRSGDIDNHGKSVLDALNGVVYPDDSAIIGLHVQLIDGEGAGVRVRATRLEP